LFHHTTTIFVKTTIIRNIRRIQLKEEPTMEVRTLINEGEGYLVEFKESANDSIQREIVAFSNSSGGRILIGVNDAGGIVGIRNMNRTKSIIQDMAHNCGPPITVAIDRVGNLMVVDIPEGMDKPYSCREGFFIRVGPNTQK